ncbi:MAG: hypothetical protein ACTHOH_03665 [Lysobacteraceae bacterium]
MPLATSRPTPFASNLPFARRSHVRSSLAMVLVLWWAVLSTPGPAAASDEEEVVAAATPRVGVELTFLKSRPGERDDLIRFIEANWFAMDRIAVAQGLMRDYRLLEASDDAGDWDVVVEVTYRDERGYAGVTEAFERIRAAHRTVTVDGQDRLAAFGKIVASRRTLTRAIPAPPASSPPTH